MDDALNCRIKFFGHYRLVEWVEQHKRKTDQRYQRFINYLNWHRPIDPEKLQNPYIRGSLVRSYMIWNLEEMFAFFKDQFQECCPGHMKYHADLRSGISEKNQSDFLRRRNRYQTGKSVCTNKEDACIFCQILGAFDAQHFAQRHSSKDNQNGKATHPKYNPQKNQKSVRFLNFIPDDRFTCINDLASVRYKNRYDRNSQKARDYFQIWEANHFLCSEFFGKIVINTDLVKDVEKVKCLIAAGLSRINYLAGSPCRIDIGEKSDGQWDMSIHQQLLDSFHQHLLMKDCNCDLKTNPLSFIETTNEPTKNINEQNIPTEAETISEDIINTMQKYGKTIHIRSFADAIYELRRISVPQIEHIPEINTATAKQTFWGLLCKNNKSIKQCIVEHIKNKNTIQKQHFFECLRDNLYLEAKALKIVHQPTGRIIGENEYYARQASALSDRYETTATHNSFWIITGFLESQTPFFFGSGLTGGNTDIPIVTDANGHLRLPYDVLRGVFRRDLSSMISNCNVVDIGISRPCNCPVCQTLSQCKFEDSIASDYSIPPEIRQRIKISPHTGVVEHGALFNIEIGPQGLRFPLMIKHYPKDKNINEELKKVLGLWSNNQCVIGGQLGTGKGRFNLVDLKWYNIQFNLQSESRRSKAIKDYYRLLKHRGYIGLKKTELDHLIDNKKVNIDLTMTDNESYSKVAYTLYFETPVISNDPIAALIHEDTPDAIMFKKTLVSYDDNGMSSTIEIYSLKGEGIRGVIRYLVGKNENCHDLIHEDCNCMICNIFGNNQTGGYVRFEDANLVNHVKPVRFDHVAIDWIGAKEHAKFDVQALPGNPHQSLAFNGIFWISKDLDDACQNAIKKAFIELQNKMSTLGANGASGYGWISKIQFMDGPDWLINQFPEPVSEIQTNRQDVTDQNKKPEIKLNLSKDQWYHPYYFLKPSLTVKRSNDLTTHECYHKEKLSGVITCDLHTLSPFFIPDTTQDNSLDLILNADSFPENHKRFRFFRINDQPMIPASSIRGMVGYIFQLLTNSCFRNLDESAYITRRMDASKAGDLKCGIVRKDNDGNLYITECNRYRLPLYDDMKITNGIGAKDEYLDHMKAKNKEQRLRKAINNNKALAKYAEQNRAYLLAKDENTRIQLLSGKQTIQFNIVDKPEWKQGGVDKIVVLTDLGSRSGYIKFTGTNNANKKLEDDKKTSCQDITFISCDQSWDPWKLNILLKSKSPELRPETGKNNYYPRPVLYCKTKDNTEYTISKRCERVFEIPYDKSEEFMVTNQAKKQYKEIIKSYDDNTGKIDSLFRTQFHNDALTVGDLVYFEPQIENNNVLAKNITPVNISRESDDKPMRQRFEEGFESLRPCIKECSENCATCNDISCLESLLTDYSKGLCPTCRLFGTTTIKSRLRFGFARLTDTDHTNHALWYANNEQGFVNNTKGTPLTLPLLERPRVTWAMPDKKSCIPGRKLYVNHPKGVKIQSATPTENNRTIEPMAAGNTFRFQIVFENISEWEIGLLLYSLELENNMAHRLGMGKPLGMGSVNIQVRDILIRKSPDQYESRLDSKEFYIDKGKNELSRWFNNNNEIENISANVHFDHIPHIQDMKRMLLIPDKTIDIRYPELKSEKEIDYEKLKKKEADDIQKVLYTPWTMWDLDQMKDRKEKKLPKNKKQKHYNHKNKKKFYRSKRY